MKFITVIFLIGVVALVSAAEKPAEKLEPVQEAEPSADASRAKRGFVLSAYTAPVAAVPGYTAAFATPVAYATRLPYAYSAYAPYYAYRAVTYL